MKHKSQENAVFIAIHPPTYRSGGFLAHGVLNNGGAGKIFLDLQKNNSEYIILKNDRPAAVLLSMDKYEKLAEKSEKLDALMEVVENTELLLLANQAEMSPTVPFEEILKKEGITEEELEKLSESVDLA